MEGESNLWLSSADRIRGYRPLSAVFADTVVVYCVCVFYRFLFYFFTSAKNWLPLFMYVPCHPSVPQCLSRAPSSETSAT